MYCSNIVSSLYCSEFDLVPLQGVYICACPFESYSFYYTNAIFQENQEKLEKNFFPEIKALYCSNSVSILFCPSSTNSTFTGGLHLCTSCELYSCYYTKEIFQENQEQLERCFLGIKASYSSNISSSLFFPNSTINTFTGDLHLCMSYELCSYNYTNAIFQENQEELETSLFSGIEDLYFSNIALRLYYSKFTVSTFSGGLHLCASSESHRLYFTNAIF